MPAPFSLYAHAEMQSDRIRDDVRRQLLWQSDIESSDIQVQVADSVVTLSGRVETRLERLEAENAAKAVHGVTMVKNDIEVIPTCVRTDREIQDEINASLRRRTCVLEELPRVLVVNGVVTLRGNVRWNFQRDSASRVADAVPGVCQVNNLIRVVPNRSPIIRHRFPRRRPDTTPASLSHTDPQSLANRDRHYLPPTG
jgi:osmotically-inducible protein OsmY